MEEVKNMKTATKQYNNEEVLNFSKLIFWDVHPNELDFAKNGEFIVERVMRYGDLNDWRILKRVYGKKKIGDIALQIRNLDDFSLSFLSTVLKIPEKRFRCYTDTQSPRSFWQY